MLPIQHQQNQSRKSGHTFQRQATLIRRFIRPLSSMNSMFYYLFCIIKIVVNRVRREQINLGYLTATLPIYNYKALTIHILNFIL